MAKQKTNRVIKVQEKEITVTQIYEEDYISLTDMVKGFEGSKSLVGNWLRTKNTVDFIGYWERLNNPEFNFLEFEGFKTQTFLIMNENRLKKQKTIPLHELLLSGDHGYKVNKRKSCRRWLFLESRNKIK